jgi:hypothetical protein
MKIRSRSPTARSPGPLPERASSSTPDPRARDRVLSFLEEQDLIRVARVSSVWYRAADSPLAWKQLLSSRVLCPPSGVSNSFDGVLNISHLSSAEFSTRATLSADFSGEHANPSRSALVCRLHGERLPLVAEERDRHRHAVLLDAREINVESVFVAVLAHLPALLENRRVDRFTVHLRLARLQSDPTSETAPPFLALPCLIHPPLLARSTKPSSLDWM